MARHRRRKHTARPFDATERSERPGHDGKGERLQKVLAAAGVGSRRDCEELITEGRVEIDRQVVTELGTRVDPLRQEIRVDGEALRQPQRLYFAVNKPIDVVTTNFDPSGRPRVIDLVPTDERVFAVGRLDRSSEGLILVTNDGEFANRITHPRYGVEKSYLVRVAGQPTPADLTRLRKGVYLSDGVCRVQSIVAKKKQGKSTDLVIVLNEGRNRELRRILARVGHKVLRLKRIAVGPIKLADLPTGAWRRLMPGEIESLLRLAKEKRKAAKSKKRGTSDASQKRAAMKPVGGQRTESPYIQQQALMAQPLSLNDLLRDDLEEGNLAAEPGGDEDGVAVGNALRGVPDVSHDDELRFSDDLPAKRGAVIGEQDASPRPPKFKPRGKKPFRQPRSQPGERRAEPAGRRKFQKPGDKRFAKPGGKRFGKPGGKRFGKPFGKKKGRR